MATYACGGGNAQRNNQYPGEGIEKRPKLLWSFNPEKSLYVSPVVADGTVFLACRDEAIHAVDALTGKESWSQKIGTEIYSTPAYEAGMIFFGARDDCFYALDAGTGQVVWKQEYERSTDCSPIVLNGMVYVGIAENFYALDARTGDQKWSYKFSDIRSLEMSPVVWGDLIVVGSKDGFLCGLCGLDIKTGGLRWRYPEADDTFLGQVRDWPVASDGILCLAEGENYVAIDINTGAEKWLHEFEEGGADLHEPAIAEGLILCHDRNSHDQSLLALDLQTGEEAWKFVISNFWRVTNAKAPPAVAGGIAHYVTGRGIIALDAKTAEFKWMSKGKESGDSSAAIVDGVLYYWSNRDYCLKAFQGKGKKR